MGSLNYNGSHLGKDYYSTRNIGNNVKVGDSNSDSIVTNVSNDGTTRTVGSGTTGVVFTPQSTNLISGMSQSERNADNSVEREKFTSTGLASGVLKIVRTRQIDGIQTSVSTLEAVSSLGPAIVTSERKIFFLPTDRVLSSGFADWTIFDNLGVAVGAGVGTTDIDISPAATFAGASGETPV